MWRRGSYASQLFIILSLDYFDCEACIVDHLCASKYQIYVDFVLVDESESHQILRGVNGNFRNHEAEVDFLGGCRIIAKFFVEECAGSEGRMVEFDSGLSALCYLYAKSALPVWVNAYLRLALVTSTGGFITPFLLMHYPIAKLYNAKTQPSIQFHINFILALTCISASSQYYAT